MKRNYNEIEWFRKQYLQTPRFKEVLDIEDSSWLQPKRERIGRVSKNVNKLVFRNGKTEREPKAGLKKHGPYKAPDEKHIGIFFIVH